MQVIKKKTLLVDGNSLLMTMFEASWKSFGITETSSVESTFNGVYAFLYKLRIILDQGSYNNLRIVFDSSNSGFLRKQLYADYKISRQRKKETRTEEEEFKYACLKSQKNTLQSYLVHFCNIYEDAVVEADDVIAYYVDNKDPNEVITIVTGDMDIMQLIQPNVEILYLQKKFKSDTYAVKKYQKTPESNRQHILFNKKKFIEFYGYPPENITLIKTICGDASDDIANVKSIGEKTLLTLFPEICKKPMEVNELLEKAETMKLLASGKANTKIKNILNGVTTGAQGKEIIDINKRLVYLSNKEFVTDECIANLNKIGFLSEYKYKAIDSIGLLNKMQQNGFYEHILKNFKSLKLFFKPFTKTFMAENEKL